MKTLYIYLTLFCLLLGSLALNVYQWQNGGKPAAQATHKNIKEAAVSTGSAVTHTGTTTQPADGGMFVSFDEAEKTLGCDLSHWDGKVNWIELKKSKVQFVFVKATQGTSYVDPTFEENWITSKNYGFIRGAYHFFQPGKDAKAQADHFLATVSHEKGDIVPVLDIEIANGTDPQQLTEDVKVWIEAVKEEIGRYPIIYTDRGFWDKNMTEDFSHCPLWLAQWENTHEPTLPKGWNEWSFWQYTQTGSVGGVKAGTNVDLNHFNGHISALRNYILD